MSWVCFGWVVRAALLAPLMNRKEGRAVGLTAADQVTHVHPQARRFIHVACCPPHPPSPRVQGDDVFFAATGVSDGDLLRGVRYFSGGASTNSIVMRCKSGTGEEQGVAGRGRRGGTGMVPRGAC